MHGQQAEARVVRTRCCGQPLSAALNVDLSDEGWAASFAARYRWGDWGFVVLLCWHLLPTWHQPLALRPWSWEALPSCLHHISDRSTPNTLAAWQSAVEPATLAPVDLAATRQRSWDDPCCQQQSTLLLNSAVNDREKARLRASLTAMSGAWLQALPISSVGLWMDDDVIRVAVGLRLGANLCEPHTCTCGVPVDARGTPRLACKRSAGRHPRHDATTSCGVRCCVPRSRAKGTGGTQQVRREAS